MGLPIPSHIVNAPKLYPGSALFMTAFSHLDTERFHSSDAPCPIPFSKIAEYAIAIGHEDPLYFVDVIRAVDDWHIGEIFRQIREANGKSKVNTRGTKFGRR